MRLVTTLGKIRYHEGRPLGGSYGGWRKLLDDLRETEWYNSSREVSLRFILNEYGLHLDRDYGAIWLTRCFPELATPIVLYALWCSERVRHLMTDQRSTDALVLARRYLIDKKTSLLRTKEICKLKEYTRAALKIAAEHAKEAAIKAKKEEDLAWDVDKIAKSATADAARAVWLVAISAAASCDERDHVCVANYAYYSEGLYVSGDTLYDVVYSAVCAASDSLSELTKEERAREEKAQTEEFLRMIDCIENGIEYSI